MWNYSIELIVIKSVEMTLQQLEKGKVDISPVNMLSWVLSSEMRVRLASDGGKAPES